MYGALGRPQGYRGICTSFLDLCATWYIELNELINRLDSDPQLSSHGGRRKIHSLQHTRYHARHLLSSVATGTLL